MDHLPEVLTGIGLGALAAGLLALVCWILSIGLKRPPVVDAQGATTLRLKALVRSVGIVGGLVLPTAVLLGAVLTAVSEESPAVEALFLAGVVIVALVLGCGPLFLAGFSSRLVISAAGVTHYPWRGLPVHFCWEDLAGVSYAKLCGRYTLHAGPGREMHVSSQYDGLPLLFDAIEQHCAAAPETDDADLAAPSGQHVRTSESGVLS